MQVFWCPDCDRQLMVRSDGQKFCYHCFDIVTPIKVTENPLTYMNSEAGRYIVNAVSGASMFVPWEVVKKDQDKIDNLSSQESIQAYKEEMDKWKTWKKQADNEEVIMRQLRGMSSEQLKMVGETFKIG